MVTRQGGFPAFSSLSSGDARSSCQARGNLGKKGGGGVAPLSVFLTGAAAAPGEDVEAAEVAPRSHAFLWLEAVGLPRFLFPLLEDGLNVPRRRQPPLPAPTEQPGHELGRVAALSLRQRLGSEELSDLGCRSADGSRRLHHGRHPRRSPPLACASGGPAEDRASLRHAEDWTSPVS